MKRNITQKQSNLLNSRKKKVVAPSVETLNFIKEFARSYYVEKNLPASLSGVCVN